MLTLFKFALRRDRIGIIAWVAGIMLITLAVVGAYQNIFTTSAQQTAELLSMMENPAMIAMVGPVYGDTLGALLANGMLLITALSVVIMNIFLVVRHTRNDEELGRLELIRSFPVTRLTTLKSTLLLATLTNLLIALFTSLGLGVLRFDTIDMGGSLLYGAAIGSVGLAFAGLTAILVQLSENNRKVLTYAFIFLGIAYAMRAIGDVGNETLSAISLLGLSTRTEVFVNNYWWPVIVAVISACIFAAIALYLNSLRDLGAGFITARPGRRNAGFLLQTNFGLALKLSKGSLIGWSIAVFALGGAYGAAFGDLEGFLEGNDMFAFILEAGYGMSLIEGFMSFLMVIIAIFTSIPVITLVLKIKGEEKRNRTEHILSRYVSRNNLLANYVIISIFASILMLFLGALGLYVASASVMDESIAFGTFIGSAMNYLPAVWIIMGLSIFLIGLIPKATGLVWAYLGFSFFAVYLGGMLEFPEWIIRLSPFGNVPQMPVDDFSFAIFIIMKLIALALIILGFIGYRNRDIHG